MNRPESDLPNHERAGDEPLQRTMLGLPFPPTPQSLAQQTRRRVQGRRFRRRATIGGTAVAVLLCGVLISRPWNRTEEPQQIAASQTLDADTLADLFALPPVDSLAVLDRRLDVEARILNRKEQRP